MWLLVLLWCICQNNTRVWVHSFRLIRVFPTSNCIHQIVYCILSILLVIYPNSLFIPCYFLGNKSIYFVIYHYILTKANCSFFLFSPNRNYHTFYSILSFFSSAKIPWSPCSNIIFWVLILRQFSFFHFEFPLIFLLLAMVINSSTHLKLLLVLF